MRVDPYRDWYGRNGPHREPPDPVPQRRYKFVPKPYNAVPGGCHYKLLAEIADGSIGMLITVEVWMFAWFDDCIVVTPLPRFGRAVHAKVQSLLKPNKGCNNEQKLCCYQLDRCYSGIFA
jgi:hypothetical protein